MDSAPAPTPPAAETAPLSFTAPVAAPSNFGLGLLAGSVAALVGAAAWAGITVVTNMRIGYVAVGVAFLVGLAVRYCGRGTTIVYGVTGAVLALLGCLLGDVLSAVGSYSIAENAPFFATLRHIDLAVAVDIIKEGSTPITYVIYGFAVFCGFKYSMVTEQG